MPRAKCTSCGAKLPAKSKFCPECGTAVQSGDTVVQELPATETGPVPVEQHVSQRRLFGVPPASALLVLGIAGVIVSIVLFATGYWPWGLIALGLALFLFTGAAAEARRLPDDAGAAGYLPLGALESLRSRAGAAKETVAAHGSARIELVRLRREVAALTKERAARAQELGEAVYAKNTKATKDLKERIKEIDDAITDKEGRMAQVTIDATDRIQRARMQVQPTEVISEGVELPDQPPEPAQIPEPGPAQVPEPYPPPDEGDRPQPPELPEPTPK